MECCPIHFSWTLELTLGNIDAYRDHQKLVVATLIANRFGMVDVDLVCGAHLQSPTAQILHPLFQGIKFVFAWYGV